MKNMLPILFNTEMSKAILNDRKTATRRLLKLPMKITIELSEREIKTLEKQMSSSIKNREDAICLIHELLNVLKD